VAKRSDFRKTAQWHKAHGDVLHFEGHELSLLQNWWERESPDASMSKRVLVKASKSFLKIWQAGIVLEQKVRTRLRRMKLMFGKSSKC
jgi:hypothetical protein